MSPAATGGPLAGLFVGGRGTRLGGVAKGLLPVPHAGTTVLARLVTLVRDAGLRPVLLGTCAATERAFPDLTWLQDARDFEGPLAGLVALLRASRDAGETQAFAFACDLPFLSAELVARLQRAPASARAVAPRRKEGPWEPLVARYATSLLDLLASPGCTLRGPRDLLAAARARDESAVLALEISAADEHALVDWDTPADVEQSC